MAKKKVARSAFIPYFVCDDGTIKMLFMMPSESKYGGSKYQLCKGKVDPGENHVQAAIREAEEELGLIKSNLNFFDNLGKFLGYTEVYYGEVFDMDNFGEYCFETSSTKWMTFEEFYKEGRSIHIPVIRALERVIASSEDKHVPQSET